MKKFFCIFSLLIINYSLLISPVFAQDPIFIDNPVEFGPPPNNKPPENDVQFYSNDAINRNNVNCNTVVKIQETFQPKCVYQIVNGKKECVSYRPYTVDEIKGNISLGNNNYQNEWFRRVFIHYFNQPKSIGDSEFPTTMISYDPTSDLGANNASNRLYPEPLLSCLKGQRLTQSVLSLKSVDTKDYQVVHNEAVAWCKNGCNTLDDVIPIAQSSSNPGGYKVVRIADIAYGLSKYPLRNYQGDCQVYKPDETQLPAFYEPTASCFGGTMPSPIDMPSLGSYNPVHVDPFVACRMFQRMVQIGDIGSNARTYRIVDDANNVFKEYSSIPMGNIATNGLIPQIVKPAESIVEPINPCAIAPSVESIDKGNSVTFKDVVGRPKNGETWEVTDEPKTFTAGITLIRKIDERIPPTFANYNQSTLLFMPQEYIDENQLLTVNMATEDPKKTFDPGNGYIEKKFYDLVRPTGMQ